MQEAEVRKDSCKIVSFGGDRAVVLRNLQQLQSPAQDLCNIKLISTPPLVNLLKVDGC